MIHVRTRHTFSCCQSCSFSFQLSPVGHTSLQLHIPRHGYHVTAHTQSPYIRSYGRSCQLLFRHIYAANCRSLGIDRLSSYRYRLRTRDSRVCMYLCSYTDRASYKAATIPATQFFDAQRNPMHMHTMQHMFSDTIGTLALNSTLRINKKCNFLTEYNTVKLYKISQLLMLQFCIDQAKS